MKKSDGQTIIEAVVALSVIMIIIAAVAITVTISLNNSLFIKNQNQANKYAQQGMEYLRNMEANDSSKFNSYTGVACMDESFAITTPFGSCNTNIQNTFKRTISFDKNTADCSGTRVTVSVSWSSAKCSASNTFCHKSQLISCFSTAGARSL